MPRITIVFGVMLILLGVGYFTYSLVDPLPPEPGKEKTIHFTPLIAAGVGAVLVILGVLSFKDALRKHTMHAAAAVASLTFMVCIIRSAPGIYALATNGMVANPRAIQCQAATAAITLAFVLLCVGSFIQARRARSKAEAVKPTT